MEVNGNSVGLSAEFTVNPCITFSGAPTAETAAAAGQLYMDTDTGDLYKCTAAVDGAYTWEKVGAGTVKSVNGIAPDESGNVQIATGGSGDESQTEVLEIVSTVSYPNLTTFQYTEGTSAYGYIVAKQGTVKGGVLAVDWDVNTANTFDFNLYIFDSDGNPYLHSCGEPGNNQFAGELYKPTYFAPGEGVSFGRAVSPFTVQIPDGCTCIACMRYIANTIVSPDGSIASAADFGAWATSGALTFTVTKEQDGIKYVEREQGEENANRYMVTNENGEVVPGGLIEAVTTASINPNVKSVNHRGYGAAPENTLSAYRLSKTMGFDMVECDVAFTADGVAVLLHDATIDRTSDGTGNISDLTLEQARQYDYGSWKSADYTGEQIPTFEEFISLCRNLGLHPYIELKASGLTQDDINGLVSIVKKYGMLDKVTWISFSAASLELVKTALPKARLGFVVGSITEASITTAQGLKTEENEVFIDSYYEETTDDMVNLCIAADIPLEYWGLNTEEKVLASNPYISGFTTDTVVAGVTLYNSTK